MAYYDLYGSIRTLNSSKQYSKYIDKYPCKIFIKEKEFDPYDPEIAICKTLKEINSKEIYSNDSNDSKEIDSKEINPNIVVIYDVFPSKIILEYLPIILITPNEMKGMNVLNGMNELNGMKRLNSSNKEFLKSAINNARVFLNNMGIVYIDYKLDNIGIDYNGNYKLFDFDSSGIVNKTENKWMIEPPNHFVYRKLKKQYGSTIKNKIDYDIYAIQLFFTDIETICLD